MDSKNMKIDLSFPPQLICVMVVILTVYILGHKSGYDDATGKRSRVRALDAALLYVPLAVIAGCMFWMIFGGLIFR